MIEKDLGQIIPDITATATIDNTEGVPSVSVTVDELNELNRLVRKFNFAFLHLKGEKGDKPVKGIDYLTEEEKQQFTTETLGLVTAEGNKQIKAVGNKGTEQAGKVTSEGSKQITLVSGEANKVITQLKELIAGNPDTSNAQALSGKSRIEFERDTQALAGKYAGNFPLTSAVKDAVYLVPATGKFYVCTQAYNGSNLTAPNANFEEMSVWANRDKLGNLSGYKLVKEFTTTEINSTVEVFNYPEIVDNKNGENYFTEILVTAHFRTSMYGNIFAGAIKLAARPVNQRIATTMYKIQDTDFIEFDNSGDTLWRNHLLANIKGTNITFKVFVLKITL